MGSLAASNDFLDKYFRQLKLLDNNSKKRLIIKLAETITDSNHQFDLSNIYGKWDDSKDSDEIIKVIRESRIDNKNTESLC